MPPILGVWFTPIGDTGVKQANLNIFYHLGLSLRDIDKLEPGMDLVDAVLLLFKPQAWLVNFLHETKGVDIPESRDQAAYVISAMDELAASMHESTGHSRTLAKEEVHLISTRKRCLKKNLSVNTATLTFSP